MRTGHFLNIGLEVGKESTTGLKIGQDINPKSIINFLSENIKGYKIVTDREIVDEDTLVLELYRKIDDISMNIIMNMFGQLAIPQLSNGVGKMHGSTHWGDFNPYYFIMTDGTRLSEQKVN